MFVLWLRRLAYIFRAFHGKISKKGCERIPPSNPHQSQSSQHSAGMEVGRGKWGKKEEGEMEGNKSDE